MLLVPHLPSSSSKETCSTEPATIPWVTAEDAARQLCSVVHCIYTLLPPVTLCFFFKPSWNADPQRAAHPPTGSGVSLGTSLQGTHRDTTARETSVPRCVVHPPVPVTFRAHLIIPTTIAGVCLVCVPWILWNEFKCYFNCKATLYQRHEKLFSVLFPFEIMFATLSNKAHKRF